jgi:hypothetical protein
VNLLVDLCTLVGAAFLLWGIWQVVSGEKRRAEPATKPPSDMGQVNPMFLGCLAPVILGQKPLQLCRVEILTPSGMGSYVVGAFDAAMFDRTLGPVIAKVFPGAP